MDTATIDLAIEKKYSEFESTIKDELKKKLTSHQIYKSYTDEHKNINKLKNDFKQINNLNGEQ